MDTVNPHLLQPHGPGPDPQKFLGTSGCIDFNHPEVAGKAREIASAALSTRDTDVAVRCFLFVRDEIRHSIDEGTDRVTLKASDVLHHRTGLCYSKSHLLAALLRANGIPAGLCYQRLVFDSIGSRFALHGLNAVYLEKYGWHRIDARGNKPGINALFDPPAERLAYVPGLPGEGDLPGIFSEPLPEVVSTLSVCRTLAEILERPPDRIYGRQVQGPKPHNLETNPKRASRNL